MPGAAAVSDASTLARQVRQRLESLRRAGLDRIPRPPAHVFEGPSPLVAARPVVDPTERAEPVPVPVPDTATPRPVARPDPPQAAAPVVAASLFEEPDQDLGPYVPPADRPAHLRVIQDEVASCVRCPHLASSRTRTVFGEGSPQARLMFIGEAPGADEDRTGRPFVGKAGQLLTDMITKGMGLSRDDVYIANMLKCRPPGNRDPQPDEILNCRGYLDRQIALVRPEFLCFLGRISAQAMLETALPLGRLRGKWHTYKGVRAIVTYHPAFLLRSPENKRGAWDDLKMLMTAMRIVPPERRKAND